MSWDDEKVTQQTENTQRPYMTSHERELRDKFAGQFMNSLVVNWDTTSDLHGYLNPDDEDDDELAAREKAYAQIAEASYRMADAMLKARQS